MRRDPYEVLGVGRDADDTEIKKTFRRLARELHPDVNRHDPEAEEKFKEAAEAYEILSDDERRATYDRFGFEGLDSRGYASQAHGFGSFADIFDAFFGGDPFGAAFGRGGGGRVQGGDIAVEVDVSLAEAATGRTVDVTYEVVDTCEHCHGNGAEPGTPIETCPTCGGAGTSTTVTRLLPSRRKRSSSATRTRTYRSPGGPPRSPAWPRPVSRIRCSSAMPGGMSTERVLRTALRPRPAHASQGCEGILPSPSQTSQACSRTS